ncbi:glycosyltransferase family 1 protein [Flagellimonas halotolerans]|uniref:Glycosyltransferase family 1 protein n=1 Tax=Flagellimonas halotolerans TaxID=3112164 RepID=A0ABU6ISH9_9FLAO|nr:MULTISPECIES: glycosyltransferase family 1 protein [unclassified Allomuricauda]MEC3966149.1 glycosyltransferase family 1 protein [Muricauda sp. SYSU M86414]MEC4266014.1 glycosyltransferase family 1 protein [Muricauda sp. SYSU M84420]
MEAKPIRILHVLTIMNRGGAETMVMNYYRNINRELVQFDFLLHRKETGAFDNEILSLGGKIYRMPSISPRNYFKYQKELEQFFDEHPEYQVVHSHLNALSSIIFKVAKKKGIKTRIAHSHLAVEPFVFLKVFKPNTDIKATIKDSTQSLIRRRIRHLSTHYFACGEKAGDWLFGKSNRDKVKIINNAVNAKDFLYNSEIRKKVQNELGLEDRKIIGHVGRFNEQKNHFLLIDIFHRLLQKNPNCTLLLVGGGNLKSKVQHKVGQLGITKEVVFLGLRDDIPELLQVFDLFLFPSLYEGLPVTLIEAQASGLKIVASDTITNEVDITGLITFCGLTDPIDHWAEEVDKNLTYKRKNMLSSIVQGQYDIVENAKNLQEFYLKIY